MFAQTHTSECLYIRCGSFVVVVVVVVVSVAVDTFDIPKNEVFAFLVLFYQLFWDLTSIYLALFGILSGPRRLKINLHTYIRTHLNKPMARRFFFRLICLT